MIRSYTKKLNVDVKAVRKANRIKAIESCMPKAEEMACLKYPKSDPRWGNLFLLCMDEITIAKKLRIR